MNQLATPAESWSTTSTSPWSLGLVAAIAWRNLWRNRRRTWLSAGGIAFAVLLLLFARSMQHGGYKAMIESGTGLLHGQMQIQHTGYLDDPKLEYLIPGASGLAAELANHPQVVAASPRASGFALLSVDEKSFGAMVLGVDSAAEPTLSTLPSMVAEGRYIATGEEAYIGHALARNLGAKLGDELLVLGSGREGSMAVLALTIVGIFDSGVAELDRSLVEVPLDVFREGFYLSDEAHQIVLRLADVGETQQVLKEISQSLPAGAVARPWQELMPDIEQGIAMDRVSANLFYIILTVIVLFSVVNTFIMTVFERTHELGMLLAIGMHPWRIIAMLQLEAFWVGLLGGLMGAVVASPVLVWLIYAGIPIGDNIGAAVENFLMPTHLKGGFAPWDFLMIPLIFILGCQLAAFLPGQRVRHLQPVEAIRVD